MRRLKFSGDIEIQTDHLIPARRLDLAIIKKKKEKLPTGELCRPGELQRENQRKTNTRTLPEN